MIGAFFGRLVTFLFFNWVAWRLTPGPKDAPAPEFDDRRIPSTTEGTPYGKGYGTWIAPPFEAWSGDEEAVPIVKKQSKK